MHNKTETTTTANASQNREQTPIERLRYHVTGAIERGEATAIVAQPASAPETRISQAEVNAIFSKASLEAYAESWRTRASEAEAQLDAVTAQRVELLAALKACASELTEILNEKRQDID